MRSRIATALDFVADHTGNAYFFALAAAGIGSLVLALVVAILTGTWWAALIVLAFPTLWFVMWRTG